MAATFRTSPMGFNKKDVIEYIEQLVSDKNGKIEAAWDEYKALEARARRTEAEASELLRESEFRAEEAESRLSALEEEKTLLEERAAGSEQAFADLEAAMQELRAAQEAELETLRTGHAAELEALRAAHAEELNAIYAERSAQLDKKSAQIRSLEAAASDKDAEIESLRAVNLRLLSRIDDLSAVVSAYENMPEEEDLPVDARPLLADFKTRFIEITGELSALAQAILDAEKREAYADEEEDNDSLTFPVDLSDDDLPEAPVTEDAEEDLLFIETDDEEETAIEEEESESAAGTRIEMTDYPHAASAPRPVQKKGPSVRDLLDRLRTIGDRLL